MAFPLAPSTPSSLGFDVRALERLQELITRHLAEGRYPAAQIAVAREGKLALARSFGDARLDPTRVPAREDSLWLLYSNTKVITACAVWILAEQGALRFTDRVADHVPGFEANGKGDITIIQLLSHQGGFPNADVPKAAWEDHELLRRTVSAFTLEWTPGSRVHYHGRAAHWVAAVLIEALSKTDYRAFIREQVDRAARARRRALRRPAGRRHDRAVDMHEPAATGGRPGAGAREENNAEFRRAGTPGGGGYATARAMAAFYQMLAAGGHARRPAAPLAPHGPVRHAQRHGRSGGRLHGHAHAPRPRPPRAGDDRVHPGPRQHRLPADVRPRRRGVVLLLGGPGLGRVVRLPDEQPGAGSVAQPADGRDQQRRALGHSGRALRRPGAGPGIPRPPRLAACERCAIMTPPEGPKDNSDGSFPTTSRDQASRRLTQATVAQGARAGRTAVHPAQGPDARVEPPLGLRGGALPEHRRVLGGARPRPS